MVEDSPLWSDASLFHHDEHMTERGREIWTASIIAKLRDSGLPGSCAQAEPAPDASLLGLIGGGGAQVRKCERHQQILVGRSIAVLAPQNGNVHFGNAIPVIRNVNRE